MVENAVARATSGDGVELVLSDPPEDLTVPISSTASLVQAILAKRGSGKSYLAGIFVEELLACRGRPAVVVFDPTGAWWGLLAEADGRPSVYGTLLLGGSRGHWSIGSQDGAAIADLASEVRAGSIVVDLSLMAPSEQHEVVADFSERLLALSPFPIHVVLDEADEFAPQRLGSVGGQQRRSLGFVERLVMRGRARGIGVTLISLRPAVLSKNVLSQVDAMFFLRMIDPRDIRAVQAWLANFEAIGEEQKVQCLGYLPVLPVGTAYYLCGGEASTFRRFRVRQKRTYDSSRTPGTRSDVVVLAEPEALINEAARRLLAREVVR
jgi:DNA helicase HerA-like ATPase